MKSVGINKKGEEIEFKGAVIYCQYEDFTSLTLNNVVKMVSCENNKLTSLILNYALELLYCDNIDLFNVKPQMDIMIFNYIK